MSGTPKTSAKNGIACTGDWAGHTSDDDRHCVCWWDSSGPCCQCGADPRDGAMDEGTNL